MPTSLFGPSKIECTRRLPRDSSQEVLKHLHRLWDFTVRLEAVDEDGAVERVGERLAGKSRLIPWKRIP